VETLPVEPLEVAQLLTFEKPDGIDKLNLVRIRQNEDGLFAASKRARTDEEAAPEPEPAAVEEDDDVVLDRIRAQLKAEDEKNRDRRNRENRNFSTIRSAVSPGMDDDMKRQAIGSLIFERGMDVLGAEFDEVFEVSAMFLEKNSVEHILSDLSQPADFHLELRAIYQFLKEKKKLP